MNVFMSGSPFKDIVTSRANIRTKAAELNLDEDYLEENLAPKEQTALTMDYEKLVDVKLDNDDYKYPYLHQYTKPVKKAEREIVGREKEIERLMAAMMRPELCNVILLAEAGTGKTALVQGTMLQDVNRLYVEVDLSHMIADLQDPNQMGDRLKQLFAETQSFREETDVEIVLFMDEFHQVVQLSAAAVEALKPLLADSGTRGIRVIAATTYDEFRRFIQPNQPLVERLQRINLDQPGKATTVQILRGMAKRYGVENQFVGNRLFEQIYDLTNRYIPSNSQPRKSILVLDSMVGWHKLTKRRMDLKMLADVIYESEGINIAFRVDASKIKEELDAHVFAQQYATSMIEERLQVCVADLNDKTKPMSSFLFSGATGTGKGLTDETDVPVWTEDGSVTVKRNGDLEIGDYVFNRYGKPVLVTGVYHRGMQDIYKVSLNDGRCLYTDSSHLFTYLQSKGKATMNTYTNSVKELYDRGVYIEDKKTGRRKLKYWIPMNEAVEYPERKYSVHPYVMGAMIGNGCLTSSQLTISSNDEILVNHVADLLGDCIPHKSSRRNFSWTFDLENCEGLRYRSYQTKLVFADYPELLTTAEGKHIPDDYMYGSVEQRWQLVKGLFDTDGCIGSEDGGRYDVSFSSTSLQLIKDLQKLLYSLGVGSTYNISRHIDDNSAEGNYTQYSLHIKSLNEEKDRFFWLDRKVAIANDAKQYAHRGTKSHKKDYSWVGIADIEKMNYQKETTCIMVDDEEHLYQAGDYVVSHNTEVCKQLARILFQDEHRLIRFDMTEYANPESLNSFKSELTNKVWARPYSIILLDEVEKACSPVTRLLLQVLDDGRLMDDNNREVPFTNSYIIMTTNAGSEVYKDIAQYASSDTGDGSMMFKYEKLIRESIAGTTGDNRFPPELLGRIDCIVPFQPLSESTQMKIIQSKAYSLINMVREKHGVTLEIPSEVVEYICFDRLTTDSDAGGARAAIAKLQQEVYTTVARFINEHPEEKHLGVKIEGTQAWKDKSVLNSDAHIYVYAIVTNA